MSLYRYLLLPVLAVPPLLLTGALSRPAPGTGLSQLTAAPVADLTATRLFDQALARLQPERMPWLRTEVWQRVACEDFTYQAEGQLATGPGHRLRLDLQVRLGKSLGRMLVVCDGTTLWQSTQVDGMERQANRIHFPRFLQTLEHAPASSPLRADFLAYQGFAGLAALLQGLKRQMLVTGQEAVTWNGQEVIRLTLAWSNKAAREIIPEGQSWPAYLPRTCLVYLNPATLWPRRLECWGRGQNTRKDFPILQMEFRPRESRSSQAYDQSEQEFTFDGGTRDVPDITNLVVEQLNEGFKEQCTARLPAGS